MRTGKQFILEANSAMLAGSLFGTYPIQFVLGSGLVCTFRSLATHWLIMDDQHSYNICDFAVMYMKFGDMTDLIEGYRSDMLQTAIFIGLRTRHFYLFSKSKKQKNSKFSKSLYNHPSAQSCPFMLPFFSCGPFSIGNTFLELLENPQGYSWRTAPLTEPAGNKTEFGEWVKMLYWKTEQWALSKQGGICAWQMLVGRDRQLLQQRQYFQLDGILLPGATGLETKIVSLEFIVNTPLPWIVQKKSNVLIRGFHGKGWLMDTGEAAMVGRDR